MDESLIITESEKYLNQIEKEEVDLSNLNTLESFLNVYTIFYERLNHLQDMRENMDENGYTAPYRSLNRYGSSMSSDLGFDEISEVNRHNQYFRMKATAKKNILDRVKSAIDAHKIAIGHLEEYARFKCKDCSKSYRPSNFINRKGKCKCGSENFELKIIHSGIYRLEIISYLPLSGNYMVLMSGLSNWGRSAFKKVLNLLKQKRKGVVKTVSPIVRVMEKGRWIRKRVSLDSEFADCYEDEVRRQYGKNVRIERLEFHRTKPTIINDKQTITALAIAYARYSEEIVKRNKEEIINDNIEDISKLSLYDQVNKEVKLEKPNFIESSEALEEWHEYKINENLQELGLIDSFGNLNHNLKKDINKREEIENEIFAEIAPTLILWDISKYYLCTSNDRRKRYGGPFPYIRGDIDRQQRRIFQNSHRNVVKLLKDLENEHILAVPEMDLILHKKFNLEELIKNANIKLNYAALGPAMICINSEISISEASYAFKIGEKWIKREIENIKQIKKPRSKKSKQFLEMIKK